MGECCFILIEPCVKSIYDCFLVNADDFWSRIFSMKWSRVGNSLVDKQVYSFMQSYKSFWLLV